MRYYGCHVSCAGGLENAIMNGMELGVNAIQLHPSPPQRWNWKPFAPGLEEGFVAKRSESEIAKVFFHGLYLINLATPDPKKLDQGKKSLVYYLDLLSRVSGDGVIFHVGSFKDQEDEDHALRQAMDAVNAVLDEAPPKARLLLEVSAGGGKVIGARMEQLAEIYEGIKDKSRVGFALDTQHMWASGYDLREGLEEVVRDIDSILGADRIYAIHLNDSKTELASRRDRHANLGEGLIGWEALSRFVHHEKLKHIPLVLETPAMKSLDTAKVEVDRLRELLR